MSAVKVGKEARRGKWAESEDSRRGPGPGREGLRAGSMGGVKASGSVAGLLGSVVVAVSAVRAESDMRREE